MHSESTKEERERPQRKERPVEPPTQPERDRDELRRRQKRDSVDYTERHCASNAAETTRPREKERLAERLMPSANRRGELVRPWHASNRRK
jgi:hypothetical protein